jgi:hypothetical protein
MPVAESGGAGQDVLEEWFAGPDGGGPSQEVLEKYARVGLQMLRDEHRDLPGVTLELLGRERWDRDPMVSLLFLLMVCLTSSSEFEEWVARRSRPGRLESFLEWLCPHMLALVHCLNGELNTSASVSDLLYRDLSYFVYCARVRFLTT